MENLETLLSDLGVSIRVVCPEHKPTPLAIHELTNACKPSKVISVNVHIKSHVRIKIDNREDSE